MREMNQYVGTNSTYRKKTYPEKTRNHYKEINYVYHYKFFIILNGPKDFS